jgi:hypothetical protein
VAGEARWAAGAAAIVGGCGRIGHAAETVVTSPPAKTGGFYGSNLTSGCLSASTKARKQESILAWYWLRAIYLLMDTRDFLASFL